MNRMSEHEHKVFEGFSAKYGLDRLVWYEEYETRDEAFKRERQLKKWNRAWKIELIQKKNPNWDDLQSDFGWVPPKGNGSPLSRG